MQNKERFLRTMRCEEVDRRPLHVVWPWFDTLARWRGEGLPADVKDVHAYLGIDYLQMVNISGTAGIYPPFEEKIIKEDDETIISIDGYGRMVRNFRHHTSFPEWIDFPVKGGRDLQRVMDEHFDIANLDARFDKAWQENIEKAKTQDAMVVLDGGCYYWMLRSLAGVETASYLFYDAPDEVEELFERYFTVVMEGLRRSIGRVKIDVMGFGEDIACKNGPLISPDMFRKMILPRYKKTMDEARRLGIEFTWYDSDGDIRLLLSDLLSAGINGIAPCEVAARMDPVKLRKHFGRDLRMFCGFDKRIVAEGPAAIDAEITRLRPLINEGGFLPAIDHSISADISFDNYRHFLDTIQKVL